MILIHLKNIITDFFALIYNSRRSRCVFYHDIHKKQKFTSMSTSAKLFKEHILFIRNKGFNIVHNIEHKNYEIEIHFDDGWCGIYYNLHLITQLNVPVTIFLITSLINTKNYLTTEQIKEMDKNPLINFQSHTHTHVNLTELLDSEIDLELKKSKNMLKKICSNTIDSICYPRGFFCKKIIKQAVKTGYRKQYCSIPGAYFSNIFGVKKRSLIQDLSLRGLNSVLKGCDNILYFWYLNKHFKR